METHPSKVLHPSWDKKHRVPHQTLKPSFEEHRFEEAFASWEFEVNRYERENTVTIPDSIKIAILLNEAKGALQQHLQLTASNTRDYNTVREIITEYYRTTASFSRMQQIQSLTPTPQTIRQHHKVQHQWALAQLTTAVGTTTKENDKERRAIRKEKESIKEKDTTAPTATKGKEKEDIPSAKEIHFNKEIHSKEHQKEKERTHRTST